MTLQYTNTSFNRNIATLRDAQGAKSFELLIFPLSFYTDRQDDIEDTYVPYTFEMYFKNKLCSQQVVSNQQEIDSFFIEAIDKFIEEVPFKSLFFTVDNIVYDYCWTNLVPNLTSLKSEQMSWFNNEVTREKLSHWPNFTKRFGHRKWSSIIKNQYLQTYAGVWWNVNKSIKG